MLMSLHCVCVSLFIILQFIVALLMSLHPAGAFYSKPIMPWSAAYNDSSTHSAVKQGNQMLSNYFSFLFSNKNPNVIQLFSFLTFSFSNKHPNVVQFFSLFLHLLFQTSNQMFSTFFFSYFFSFKQESKWFIFSLA